MTTVSGDPDAIRSLGRNYGAQAYAAHAQASTIVATLTHVNTTTFAGPAGDKVRAFLSELHGASTAAAEAFDHVASQIPRVAQAIEEAQKDEASMDRAKQRYLVAQQAYNDAQSTFTQAAGAVGTAEAAVAGAAVEAALGHAGPLAQAERELAQAERTMQRAQHAMQEAEHTMQEAQRTYQQAQRTFDHANQERQSVLQAFAALCEEEAGGASCSLPAAPQPGSLITAGDTAMSWVSTLLTLMDIPSAVRVPISNVVKSPSESEDGDDGDDDPDLWGPLNDMLTEMDTSSSASDKALAYLHDAVRVAVASGVLGPEASGVVDAAQAGTLLGESNGCDSPPLVAGPIGPEKHPPTGPMPPPVPGRDPSPLKIIVPVAAAAATSSAAATAATSSGAAGGAAASATSGGLAAGALDLGETAVGAVASNPEILLALL